MVKSANMNGLLDSDSDSLSSCQHRVKARLREIMQKDVSFCAEDYEKVMEVHFFGLEKGFCRHPNSSKMAERSQTLVAVERHAKGCSIGLLWPFAAALAEGKRSEQDSSKAFVLCGNWAWQLCSVADVLVSQWRHKGALAARGIVGSAPAKTFPRLLFKELQRSFAKKGLWQARGLGLIWFIRSQDEDEELRVVVKAAAFFLNPGWSQL